MKSLIKIIGAFIVFEQLAIKRNFTLRKFWFQLKLLKRKVS